MPTTDLVVPQPLPGAVPAQRKSGWIYGIGRLRAGQTIEQAAAEMATLSRQFESEFPEQNTGTRYEVLSLRESLVGDTRRPLLLLLGAVGFVLLMACANVGNLMLARALGRQHELAVRLALGASPGRLAAHVLPRRSVSPWPAARWPSSSRGMPRRSWRPWCRTARWCLASRRSASTRACCCLRSARPSCATLIFGGVACLGLMRRESGALRERQATLTPRAKAAASSLVATQVALAVVLLAGAGLTLRSFSNLLAVNPGFTPAGVLTLQLSLPEGRYDADDARRAFYSRAFEAIEALPEVETVGAAMVTPLTGNNWTAPLQRVDRPLAAGQRPPEVGWQMASRGYFRALQIPLRAGRLFEPRDATGPAVVIISEAAATRHFPGEQALGHRVSLGDTEAEIVGVVGEHPPRVAHRRAARRPLLSVRTRDEPVDDAVHPGERRSDGDCPQRARGCPPARAAGGHRRDADACRHRGGLRRGDSSGDAPAGRLCRARAPARGRRRLWRDGVSRAAPHARARHAARARRDAWGIVWLVLRQAGSVVGIGLAIGAVAAVAFARTLSSVLFNVAPWDPACWRRQRRCSQR